MKDLKQSLDASQEVFDTKIKKYIYSHLTDRKHKQNAYSGRTMSNFLRD